MIHALFEQSLCMGILIVVYRLFLEREKMYTFNRVYLLFSLALSLAIPFISIQLPLEALPDPVQPVVLSVTPDIRVPLSQFPGEAPATSNLWWIIGSSIYGIVAMMLLGRFVKNIQTLVATLKQYPKVNYKNARVVLLPEPVLPYSFLNYIFVSQQMYLNQDIEKELWTHELAHVEQRHTLDILLIELLQVVFWFNPLLYVYKKAIKLNHEFLADDAVIQSCANVTAYQHLLLSKTSSQNTSSLVSTLNFSLTKKRLIMMTRITSPILAWLKKAAMLPLFACILIGFSTKLLAQQPAPKKENPVKKEAEKQQPEDMYYGNITMAKAREVFYNTETFYMTKKDKNGLYIKKKYKDLTAEERAQLPDPPQPPTKQIPTQEQLNAWQDAKKYGLWLDGKRVDNAVLKQYKHTDFGMYFVSKLHKNAKNYGKHYYQVDVYTQQGFNDMRAEWLAKIGIKE